MDTVLDGLDPEKGAEEGTEIASDPASVSADERMVLEDILSSSDAVVTDEPAKKSGQGEPTPKKENPAKSHPKESSKKVLIEDNVTVPGDVNIDNILDDLSSL
jgi:hypothetical protein